MQLPYTVEAAAHTSSRWRRSASARACSRWATPTCCWCTARRCRRRCSRSTNSPAAGPAPCACPSRRPARRCRTSSTRAVPDGADFEADPLGPRYRLTGNKMWISAGEHELTENIIHLVLAKIPGPDGKLIPGTRGISLFIVPKKLVDTAGPIDRRAQRRGAGRPEPQAGLARHHQHAAQFRRGQVPGAAASPARWATWWAARTRACAACST